MDNFDYNSASQILSNVNTIDKYDLHTESKQHVSNRVRGV